MTPYTWRVARFPILASTNDLALEWMRAGTASAGDVLVTAEQIAGRGRPGRIWHSPRGALLMTAILPFLPERVGWTSLAAGIAVAHAARDLGVRAGVKWPNDVVLERRKLAGILAETSVPHLVAVGIGLNVSNPPPPDAALAARTTRLAEHLPTVSVDQALDAVLTHLAQTWRLLEGPDLTPLRLAWEELDTTAGRRLRWSERALTGTALGVDDHGALRIRAEDGTIHAAPVGEVGFLD